MIVFITSVEKIRNYMWKAVNGPYLLIGFLNQNEHGHVVKVFEALVVWSKIDSEKMNDFFSNDESIHSIFKLVFPKQM